MALIGFTRVSCVQQDLPLQLDKLEKAGCRKISSDTYEKAIYRYEPINEA
ncbi:hypothetical protein [Gallibacterium genomosp. 1]|nr:hypothetical protein [Gallibacterium genomosp. 1]